MKISSSGARLGATIEGLELSRPLDEPAVEKIIQTVGERGVLRFPAQTLTTLQLKQFAGRFGALEVNVAGTYQEPEAPEVMILSNIVRDGKPIGLADAGQGWHTDMSYSRTIAFANVLYGIEIPSRDGTPLGNTESR
jgi:taurine dioxygenase